LGPQRHLNSHQRDTLAHVFRHPLSHNIEWHAVLSLLNALGTVQETNKGNVLVTIDGETETFEPSRPRGGNAEQLVRLRRFLREAGSVSETAPGKDAQAG